MTALAVTPLVLDRGGPYLPHSAQGWLVIVAMALAASYSGTAWSSMRSRAFPYHSALLTPPVLSGAAALLLFGELPSLPQLAGAVLVLAGLCLAVRHESQRLAV